jgi:fumarate reductase flavoprotein subunit
MPIILADNADLAAHVPVVVAGGGACGLVAALAAHDAGVSVVVIERDPLPRGSTSMSLGALCAVGSADQARHGIADHADIFFADVMVKTGGTADPLIARLVADQSGATLDWLAHAHGVALRVDPNWPPAFGHSRMRMHVTPGGSGADLIDRLIAACDAVGIPILTNARLTDLIASADGQVEGVRYVRPDGSVEDIGCDALVLATCGFGGNHAMVAQHIPAMADARYFGWEGNRGDGILLGQALGGAVGDMDAYQGLGLLADPQGIDLNPRCLIEGGIQVDRRGKRFSNELADISGQGARVMQQIDGLAWVIYDERIHRSCADLPQYIALRDAGGVHCAPTADSLAVRLGIDPAGLAESLAPVPVAGADRFGRVFTTPPLRAPYFGVRVTGAVFHTQGGLRIDDHARVIRPDGSPIGNLFAGGGAARGISGTGPSGYLPGAGLCCAITLGQVAGTAAATFSLDRCQQMQG